MPTLSLVTGLKKCTLSKLFFLTNDINDLPEWNYDGSSTCQATGSDSEVIIKPKAWFQDPFRGLQNKLVLCDTYLPNGDPHPTNTRVIAEKIFNSNVELRPRFGIEQEFFLTKDGRRRSPAWNFWRF